MRGLIIVLFMIVSSFAQVFEKRLEIENIEDEEFEKELLLNFKEVVSKVQSL